MSYVTYFLKYVDSSEKNFEKKSLEKSIKK